MKAAEKLWADYQDALNKLRESCLHEDLTGWMGETLGMGRLTSRMVRVCQECGKVMEERPRLPYELFGIGSGNVSYGSLGSGSVRGG